MDILNGGTNKINSMHARELERQLNLQKKHETKTLNTAKNEQIDYFEKSFLERQYHIQNMIEQSKNLPKENLPEHFTKISKEILILQKYVAASNLFLHTYFVKKCQNVIQQLSDTANNLENQLLPKKKFGFKKKAKPTVSEKNLQNSSSDEVDFQIKNLHNQSEIQCGFVGRKNETLTLSGDEILKKDVILEKLTNCIVFLKGTPSTLFLNHLENCKIFSGPVSTSIFAENCQKCTMVIACQQLRLHSSKDVNIYLHVTSRAIMEDCTHIHFAPYNWFYEGIEEDFDTALLQKSINNWTCIDDFNWLNAEKHSPNWSEIEENDRVVKWSL